MDVISIQIIQLFEWRLLGKRNITKQPIQWRDFFNKLTFYFIIDNDLPKQDDLLRSEQSGKSFYFTNMPDDLVHEPARPDRNVFQTLISQELLEQDGSKFNRIYRHVGTEGGWGGKPPPQIIVGNSVNCCNNLVNPTCALYSIYNRNPFSPWIYIAEYALMELSVQSLIG